MPVALVKISGYTHGQFLNTLEPAQIWITVFKIFLKQVKSCSLEKSIAILYDDTLFEFPSPHLYHVCGIGTRAKCCCY